MGVTPCGVAGVRAASHVMEEKNIAIVRAPIPHQQMEDDTVGDWDHQESHRYVTHIIVQVMVCNERFLCTTKPCKICHFGWLCFG